MIQVFHIGLRTVRTDQTKVQQCRRNAIEHEDGVDKHEVADRYISYYSASVLQMWVWSYVFGGTGQQCFTL
jgi:hypothetical protein